MDDMKAKIRCDCLEKEAAPCVSACPFDFDIREFIPRVERGAFNLAYRLYANSVVFPRIVATVCGEKCRLGCPRKDVGGAVNLRLLERAAVKYATRTAPNSYNMPAKEGRIAVIGGGASGLACALRLSNRKYRVTVFEKADCLGGSLWDGLSPDIFLKDIEEQFSKEKYNLLLGEEIKDVADIRKDFDAVYVATGKNSRFSERYGVFDKLSAVEDGVYAGGSMTGVSAVEAIAQGAKAAALIEGYIKTGVAKNPEPRVPTKIKLDLSNVEGKKAVTPKQGEEYSQEEAREEASRCVKCRCNSCIRACDMMAYFQKFPKLIEEEVHITINPGTLDGNGTVATRLISTCSQCGLCGKVCPEKIDVGLFMRESHRAMRAKGAMPWAFHEFWLNDMMFARSEKAAFFFAPEHCANGKCEYLFFPGCQMGASDPRYVTEAFGALREISKNSAVYLTCCGAPACWSGDVEIHERILEEIKDKWLALGKPEFIFGCPTCREMFREFLPEIKGRQITDIFFEAGLKVPNANGFEAALFDPCAARNFEDTRRNVRALLADAGFILSPLEYEGERAKCCSWGGQISVANPPYAKWLVEKRIKEKELPYIVYCTNCRDVFAESGKAVLHILDILFDIKGADARPPTYSKRRRNRETLKEELTRELFGEETKREKRMELYMSPETEAKMHKEKILDDDVADVIAFCEHTGRKIKDTDSGRFIGYHEVGNMTCWVEYTPQGCGFFVHNAYSHRMKIELEAVWRGRKQKIDV